MLKILLIDINDREGTFGLRSLSSALRSAGHETHIVFFSTELIQDVARLPAIKLQRLQDLVREISPDLAGISITSSFGHRLAATLSASIKEQRDLPVVWGGVHPSLATEVCLREQSLDFICVGEGEESMVELCCRLEKGESAAGIPGIVLRKTGSYARRNPPLDLDALPYQDFLPENKYSILEDGTVREGEPMVRERFVTRCSRGCPYRCSYCSNRSIGALYDRSTYLRLRSVDHVMAEIQAYLEINPECHSIWFSDDTFPTRSAWLEEFTERYRRDVHVPFYIWMHPGSFKNRHISMLKTAGLRMVMMGIESASAVTRNRVFLRPETREDILTADDILTRHGLEKHYDFIIDHPWESEDELEQTYNLLMDMHRPIEVNMHSLVLLPNTDLARRAIQEERFSEDELMDNIIDNTYASSRRIQWIRGIPAQKDPQRAYWLFLIACIGNPAIPGVIIRFLKRRRVFRRYPQLLTDLQVTDIQRFERRYYRYRTHMVQQHGWVRKLIRRLGPLKKTVRWCADKLFRVFQLVYFTITLTLRFVRKGAVILFSRR